MTPPVRPTTVSASATRGFARARSFSSLRGFSRIGGVLIGNEATIPAGKALDFRDFRWDRRPDGIHLLLKRSDGRELRFGPYRQTIVHQALAYAADGRPITVTMVTAQPLHELKILLHPALLDTALGCRAIEIDRFVDTFTGRSPARQEQQKDIVQQQALYELAWADRILALQRTATALFQGDDQKTFAALVGRARTIAEDGERETAAAAALQRRQLLDRPERSVLASKPQFYEAGLVTTIRNCAKTSTALDAVRSCVKNQSSDVSLITGDVAWYAPPPTFTFWSGVRERPFEADENLRFMIRPSGRDAADRLWPLDFMLQVAFTSTPAHLPEGQSAEHYDDDTPWEFPELRSTIMSAVNSGLDNTTGAIVDDMAEFTVLQRLFRLALNDQLGPAFPLDRLAQLAKDTAPARAPRQRTLRWNVRSGAIEMNFSAELAVVREMVAAAATNDPRSLAAQALPQIDRCVAVASSDSAHRASDQQWSSACAMQFPLLSVDGSDPISQALQFINRRAMDTVSARQLRQHLGVAADERLAGASCPAIP